MNIRIRGIAYYFERHQENPSLPNLVLLHGFLGSGKEFESLIPSLKSFCNPITVDLLGHGQTEGAEMHYRFAAREQVADLAKLIKEQLTGPVFLYGYSMGARLALTIATHHPALLQGLILESGTFGIEDETERQARQALDATQSDHILGNFAAFLDEWETMPLFGGGQDSQINDIRRNQNATWMANSLLGFGTGTMPCLRAYLPKINLPVLLLAGENDAKFVRINHTMNRELPDSTLHIIPECGHRVHVEKPEPIAELLSPFITNHTLPHV